MKIIIKTTVGLEFLKVKEGFNKDLFLKLAPPFPPVKLLRFDGSKKGDQVSLELNFFLFKQTWTSLITEDKTTENEFYFIDEGVQLPFFLGYWKHRHRVVSSSTGSTIIDEIDFEGKGIFFTPLLYPALFLQFLFRRPIYKKIFGSNQG
jgi:ligand-binding SRPBCC domain-containing protein